MVKRSYILMEVIIAIGLVVMVGFLLLRAPMKSIQKEWQILVEMEYARLWNNFLIKFEQELPQKIGELKGGEEPLEVVIAGKKFVKKQIYDVKYTKKESTNTIYYDVCLSAEGKAHHFLYTQPIQNPVSSN